MKCSHLFVIVIVFVVIFAADLVFQVRLILGLVLGLVFLILRLFKVLKAGRQSTQRPDCDGVQSTCRSKSRLIRPHHVSNTFGESELCNMSRLLAYANQDVWLATDFDWEKLVPDSDNLQHDVYLEIMACE